MPESTFYPLSSFRGVGPEVRVLGEELGECIFAVRRLLRSSPDRGLFWGLLEEETKHGGPQDQDSHPDFLKLQAAFLLTRSRLSLGI